jgi:hypothetical protein
MTRTTNPCERWRLPIYLCHLLALTSRVRSITVQIQSDRRALPNNFPASGYSQEAIGFLRPGDGDAPVKIVSQCREPMRWVYTYRRV